MSSRSRSITRAPDGGQIEVFAREVVAADSAAADLPWLVYLEGGPGHGATAAGGPGRAGWTGRCGTTGCC